MASRMKPSQTGILGNSLRWISIALSILGAADAIYLLILKYSQVEAMCIGNHGCINVNNSVYSMIYGIPVSLLGLLAYLAITSILFMEPRWKLAKLRGPLAVFGLSLTGALFSAYLTYLEYFVIHAVCPFCIASAVLISLIFILSIIRLVRQPYL